MKKRLLFCIKDFNHGGIPKSLENLLALLDKDKYDITIFCAYQEGCYKSIFARYKVLPQDKLLYWFCVNYRSLRGWRFVIALIVKLLAKLLLKFHIDLFDCHLKTLANKLSDSNRYDVVIAFAEGWITRMVSYINNPERLIAWIHMDYKRMLSYESGENNAEIYDKFSYIVSPCRFSAASFSDVHPHLSARVQSIQNVLDVYSIKKASEELLSDSQFSSDYFTVVSIGRICYEKQFFEIPKIADEIRQTYTNFRWYIIGNGSETEVAVLMDNIRKYEVEDYVICLGAKDNPYPYIANSNLVALLSLSETFSYVAFEAKILGIPILTTDFGAAGEIVEDNIGKIVPKEQFANTILSFIRCKQSYEDMRAVLRTYKYDNETILHQIEKLLD